jgi:hypothetical protein
MQIRDASELMLTLMKSTGTYVYKRIENRARHREAYKLGMTKCIEQMTESIHVGHEPQYIKDLLLLKEGDANSYYPDGLIFKNENKQYYIMACKNCIEIIDNLEARFLTGGSDTDPRIFRNKNLFVYSCEDIF